MNSKYKKAIVFISIFPIIYILKEFWFFAEFTRIDRLPRGKEAVWLSNTLNQTQISHFMENNKFAITDDLIQEILLIYSGSHKYSIEITDNAAFSNSIMNNARGDLFFRKHSPILSKIFGLGNTPTHTVAGATFYLYQENFKDIVCISNTPGWQQLNKPYLQDGEPICGEGTTKYK